MYLPRHFTEDDTESAVAMARTAGFGHLTVASSEGLLSTPLPFLISDDGTQVRAHLARPNQIWKLAPCDALLVVPVSDAYISPGWYPSKAEHGKVVPTWNYEVVHAHGIAHIHHDVTWLRTLVSELTDHHESSRADLADVPPWAVTDAPSDYVDRQLTAIVGVHIQITQLDGKRKLSQNRSDADQIGTIAGLGRSGHPNDIAIAATMQLVRDDG